VFFQLAVRPTSLSKYGMTEREVISTILESIKEFKAKQSSPFWCGLLVCCSTTHDDPVSAERLANLAIEYFQRGEGVCGMGFYGRKVRLW
jgi:hypothetical protein